MATQLTIDFSQRGQQLRVLAKCVLPSVDVGSRPTSGASLKAVLRGLDDCIGSKPSHTISIAHLCQQSGRSRGTVAAALAALNSLFLITIDRHFRVVDGRAEQEASTYAIVWSNVLDYVPQSAEPTQVRREPQTVTVRRPADDTTETGSLSLRRGSSQFETGVVSEWDGGSLSLRRGSSQSETLTAVLPPVTAHKPPPTAATEHGDDGGLKKTFKTGSLGTVFRGWFDDSQLRRAVNNKDVATLSRAFAEISNDATGFVVFAAMAYDAVKTAKTSPSGLLATRIQRGGIDPDAVTTPAQKWASDLQSVPVSAPPLIEPTAPTDEDRAKGAEFKARWERHRAAKAAKAAAQSTGPS